MHIHFLIEGNGGSIFFWILSRLSRVEFCGKAQLLDKHSADILLFVGNFETNMVILI